LRVTHNKAILLWDHRECPDPTDGLPHDQRNFDQYLTWLHRSTRTHIKPLYTDQAIEDESDDGAIADVYDAIPRAVTQPERGPLQSYMVLYTKLISFVML